MCKFYKGGTYSCVEIRYRLWIIRLFRIYTLDRYAYWRSPPVSKYYNLIHFAKVVDISKNPSSKMCNLIKIGNIHSKLHILVNMNMHRSSQMQQTTICVNINFANEFYMKNLHSRADIFHTNWCINFALLHLISVNSSMYVM